MRQNSLRAANNGAPNVGCHTLLLYFVVAVRFQDSMKSENFQGRSFQHFFWPFTGWIWLSANRSFFTDKAETPESMVNRTIFYTTSRSSLRIGPKHRLLSNLSTF